MSDELAGVGLLQGRRRQGRIVPVSGQTAAAATALIAALVLIYCWRREGTLENILFTLGTTLALGGLVLVLTRRALFAAVAVGAFCLVIVAAAGVKRETMNMVVHAYDVFFYLTSWSTVSFLAGEYPGLVLRALALVCVVGAAAWLAWRLDPTRIARRLGACVFATGLGVGLIGAFTKEERRHMQFYFENLYLSSFYASWGETLGTLWHGTLLEAAPPGGGTTPLAPPTSCTPATRPPHIVLIHQESLVQPSLFPTLGYDRGVDDLFKSDTGRIHPLRVETYGGASWLTEFSLLAGVSTQAFGGMRQFVQTFMVNKLSDTLPQRLAQCGYRNVVFYPMLRNFVSNDKFYASVGLKEIFDLKAQKAKSAQERDRFYYANALDEMARHKQASDQPLFTYIQTMSAHWPYDKTFQPDMQVAGGAAGTHPEMHEYLRRVSMAKLDHDWLLTELQRRFPGEPILVVQYGDHHPSATRMLLGFGETTEVEDVAIDENSPGYITYYATRGIGYEVPDVAAGIPPGEAVDIAYLGLIIQAAARLPLSPAMAERKRLMELCRGRYNSCRDRDEILSFHRRLIDGGVIIAR
jgi:hypothetical protein